MLHLLKEFYKNPEEDHINYAIMNRLYEKSLKDYVIDCFKSITPVLKEVTLVSSNFIIDIDKVDQSNYERTRSNKQKDKNQKYVYISESRLGELYLKFKVDAHFASPDPTKSDIDKTLYYTVKLLIPIPDKNGYYLVKGKKFILQYQLTESATYTTASALVMKSLMPIKLRRRRVKTKDIYNSEYILNCYDVFVLRKYENPIYFYFAHMGWQGTLEYLCVGEYISAIREYDEDDDNYIYIKISSTFTVKVLRKALKTDYIQSILGTILGAVSNRMTIEDIKNPDMWISKIGSLKSNSAKSSHYELGKRYIILFNRMLDKATIENQRLTQYNKRDIYAIIRWLMQNYKELWGKDNLDILNKRLRCNEQLASLLNAVISEKIKRFVNTTPNTWEKLKTAYDIFFSYNGNELISKAHSSGLMRFDDSVNDMDFFTKFKVTQKGPNSAGNNKSDKTVSFKRRALHPSHIGRLDLNVCGSSEPGLTNYIVPMCETDGLYFKGAPPEPESFYANFKKEMSDIDEEADAPILIIDPVKFNLVLDTLSQCEVTEHEH